MRRRLWLLLLFAGCLIADRWWAIPGLSLQVEGVIAALIISAIVGAASAGLQILVTRLTTRPGTTTIGDANAKLSLTTSRYGEVVPRGYGDLTGFPGKYIWRGVQPYRFIATTPGGKGKPSTRQFFYAIDCAALIAVNPGGTKVKGVQRIWLDDTPIYPSYPQYQNTESPLSIKTRIYFDGVDVTTSFYPFTGGTLSLPVTDGSVNRITIGAPRAGVTQGTANKEIGGYAEVFEIRLGGQEQRSRPVVWYMDNPQEDWRGQAQVQDPGSDPPTYHDEFGIANYGVGAFCGPSYTNMVSLWWKNLQLDDHQNRLPQIRCELVFADNTVSEVIIAEVLLAGLTTNDVDVTAVSALGVSGFALPDVTSGKDVIQQLAIANQFIMPEVDGKLKAVLLNPGGTIPVVPLGDLGAVEGGPEDNPSRAPQFETLINQAQELPKRVEIAYLDRARDYSPTIQGAGRQVATNRGLVQLATTLVMLPNQAVNAAKILLHSGWYERIAYKFTLLPKYIKYHPGDWLNITTKEGYNTDVRLTKMSFAPGNPIECEAVRVSAAVYTQNGIGAEQLNTPVPMGTLPISDTELFVVELPAVRDFEDNLYGFYVAVGPHDNEIIFPTTPPYNIGKQWLGAEIWLNLSGVDETVPQYRALMRITEPAILIRLAASDMSATEVTQIFVATRVGSTSSDAVHGSKFSSMTDLQWARNRSSNLLVLGKEIIQFKTATSLVDVPFQSLSAANGMWEWWILQTIRRGMRGTTPYIHPELEAGVVYDPQVLKFIPFDYAASESYNIRAVSVGKYLDDTVPVTFAFTPETNVFSFAASIVTDVGSLP